MVAHVSVGEFYICRSPIHLYIDNYLRDSGCRLFSSRYIGAITSPNWLSVSVLFALCNMEQ